MELSKHMRNTTKHKANTMRASLSPWGYSAPSCRVSTRPIEIVVLICLDNNPESSLPTFSCVATVRDACCTWDGATFDALERSLSVSSVLVVLLLEAIDLDTVGAAQKIVPGMIYS